MDSSRRDGLGSPSGRARSPGAKKGATGVRLPALSLQAGQTSTFGSVIDRLPSSAGRSPGSTLPPLHGGVQGTAAPAAPQDGAPGFAYLNGIEHDFHGKILTGADVVRYYAAHGHAAHISLFYLVKDAIAASPYNLVLSATDSIPGDYYTMSASGVVQIYADGSPPEFTPISEWAREMSIYNVMRRLRWFLNARPAKMFRLWRENTAAARMQRVKAHLEAKLMLGKSHFCAAITDIRGHAFDLMRVPLVEVEAHAYSIDEFKTEQAELRKTRAMQKLAGKVEDVSLILNRIIKDVKRNEVQYARELATYEADPSDGATRGISTVKFRAEKLERQRSHRLAQQEVAMLPCLVRMADYMLVSGSMGLLEESIAGLRSLLDSRAVFMSELTFTEQGPQFNPVDDDVTRVIGRDTMDGLMETVKAVPRLLANPTYRTLCGEQVRGPDLNAIMLSAKHLAKCRLSCIEVISRSYMDGRRFAEQFDHLRVVQDFAKTWEPKVYKSQERDVPQFRKDMLLLRQWHQELGSMTSEQRVGALMISTKALQSSLQQTVGNALDVLRLLLGAATHRECQRVLSSFQQHVQELQQRPTKLEAFAAYFGSLQQVLAAKDTVLEEARLVRDMCDMLTDYGGKIAPNDQVALDDLKDTGNQFARSLDESLAFVDERKAGMITVLEKSIKEVAEKLQEVFAEMRSGKYDDPAAKPAAIVAELETLTEKYSSVAERAKRYREYQELFSLNPSDFSDVEVAHRELAVHRTKWQQLADFEQAVEGWMTGQCSSINPEELTAKVDECVRANYKMVKSRKDDTVVQRLKASLESFKQTVPLLQEVANPALQERHWAQVFSLLGQPYEPGQMFCARELINFNILEKYEQVQSIAATATKEYSMLKALEKMEAEWAGLEFKCVPYKDTGTFIIGGTDEIQTILDDQIVKIQAMNASPFVKPFKERAEGWEATLQTLQDMLDNWLQCQATWLYLEPIFSSDDIVRQMPEEGEKFREVDGTWHDMMARTSAAPAVIPIAAERARLDALVSANELLDAIQKGLAAYLEKKRLFFPRFFFLSNDEMLEILSETKDPTRVQPHLKKCFEGVATLTFTEDLTITAMNSIEKEAVPFKNIIDTHKARGAVERWLVEVEARMFEAIHDITRQGIEDYVVRPRDQWVLQWPGMVVLVVSAIFWTRGVTDALKDGTTAAYEAACTADLMKTVDLVRGELTGLQRATLGALVVMDVHARDVVANLAAKKVQSDSEFEWQAQLRSYWEPDQSGEKDMTVMMHMMSAELEYGYEYLGNSSRLVITPLTDRCYRTLLGAIHLNLGGAPEGPAGTGKTETTKDLAKALARQCVVFNCSDSLDYIAMGKFFKGLASSGAWACFDEFNRIDLEVLSVVAQQVLDIQRAIAARVRRFVFEGTDMTLKWSAWASITMNPGYAGRSELPDNLKALFRTVAMMVPDYAMIAEIILFSYGYLNARESAKKIVQCYKLCSEQLSSQDHYDYGMRAVMAVLRAAGNLKRRFPQEDEFVLMLRSIIDVNLCKFLSHDVPLFQGIISDLFPGVVLPKPDYAAMESAMTTVCQRNNLQPTEYFFLKVIQLYEMIVVRHGLMIVGLPFAGKTSMYRVLAETLSEMHERGLEGQQRAEHYVINPKSITMGQLYGQFDPVSHEWTDGILAVTFRAAANNPSPARKWLVLDGPVDAIWIENMNTVLDDNKKLCLNSGEIIQMSPQMNMIFEVMDLAVASPATVSRCGMVYVEPHQLGWRPLVVSWLATLPAHLPKDLMQHLLGLFDWLVPVSLRFVRREIREVAPTLDGSLVVTLTRIITSSIDHLQDAAAASALGPERLRLHLECTFIFAITWSIGGSGARPHDRTAFDQFLRAAAASALPDYTGPSGEKYTLPTDIPEGHVTLSSPLPPTDAPIYDFFFDNASDTWQNWSTLASDAAIPADASVRRIIVPTVATVRYTQLLHKATSHGFPTLVVGPTGTGKTVYVTTYLYGLPQDEWVPPNIIGFSARTTANMTQYLIDAKLDRRRKGIFGPPVGKKAVVFVDDLNMPALETYGAQPPIELLRQYMDHGGWYDRQNTFRKMDDCMFMAAMGPPGGGRNSVTPRYVRHFNFLAILDFDDSTLNRIFSTMLDWFLTTRKFAPNIAAMRDAVIPATLEVYRTVMAQLLPTPTKSHYTFNLRDISRVMQGFLMLLPDKLGPGAAGEDKYLRLWCHEILRVFYDRLVDDKDRSWFLASLKDNVQRNFSRDFDKVFKHLGTASAPGPIGTEDLRRCFFGDYMDTAAEEPGQRQYDEVQDIPALLARMEEYLVDHNSMSKRPMNLAIFLYAVEHISRICRVLKQPGAHMLGVGVGGSGRQSLSRLAAYICGMEAFQVEVNKTYTAVEWRDDLKRFTRRAGGEGLPAVFLFSDTQIKQESFVEDINNLLNSGEVPNMFPYDERAAVLELCRNQSKKEGLALETPVDLWNYFVDKTRQNLHIVLCFSPVGEAFRERLRQFPSLVNCCTIDWFQAWPDDALEAVAVKFLREVDVDEKARGALVCMCKLFHQDVQALSSQFKTEAGRINYVTPTSYLELITMFSTLLGSKRAEVMGAKRRYEVGLEKLQFTEGQVRIMQDELTALRPNLVRTVGETERLMATVQKEKTEVVEPKKAVVDEDVKKAEEAAAAANAIKTECEEALAEAIPIMNAAVHALDTIKPADIKLVQSFKNPPAGIKLVMEAVCVLLDVKPVRINDPSGSGKKIDDYWEASKKLLTDPNFVNTLKTYDKDDVAPRIIDRIRKEYTSNPEFTPANAAKASSAAEGLCKWVVAMDQYDKVARVVAPKKAALAIAEEEYNKVMDALKTKQADLKEVMDKLEALEAQLAASMKEKARLESEVELCTAKLERAEKLIRGLGGEKARWTDTANALGQQVANLTGDMVIAAGAISYIGAFTAPYREQVINKWVAACQTFSIPRSPKFSLSAVLGDAVLIRAWGIAGLPNDTFSIDNAIMVANSRRWPLMIDPQGQANKWVKNMEKDQDLRVIKLTDSDYMRTLENAIQFGIPVLLENVGEELDPSLEPLLLKQVFKQGAISYLRMGETSVEFSDQFRFYITTALRNPHYLPETSVKVTLLNFMITQDGLSDQLLGVVVAEERPDLEAQRQKLVVESAENKRKLKEIEDRILHVLSSSQGNILEDASAIQVLSEAKLVSDDIAAKQAVAEQTQHEIDEARVDYAPAGAYNAVLFFCIRDMAGIDPMYQYSLAWFITLFMRSIQTSTRSESIPTRLAAINDHFTFALYQNICRGLFEKDKLLFSFLLAVRIALSRGELQPTLYSFLLTGGVGIAEVDVARPAGIDWLSDKAWGEMRRAATASASFRQLPESVAADPAAWQQIFDAAEPQKATLPPGYGNVLNRFECLLLLRMLRPDKLVPAIQEYVSATLGQRFTEPPPFDLPGSYKESSVVAPLLFVLSPGSDPTAALLKFAEDKGYGSKTSVISMGQGQGPKAAALIEEARKAGSWVLLQNCHLAASWMPALEKITEGIKPDNTDGDFRLWMTSMPSPAFPVSILQSAVKMTNEPPAGLRANLRRSYALDPISSSSFFEGSQRPEAFKKLLFGLAFIHAFVQERRKFGPIGWNIPYGFDDGDLRISVRQLRMYLDGSETVPFDALKYSIGECNYGGRVTDDKDRRLLNTLLDRVYRPEIVEEDGCKLSASGIYFVPAPGDHSSYVSYIASLPIFPQPEAFGLHDNADISKDLAQTAGLLEAAISTGGAGGSGAGGASNEEVLVGGIVTDVLARLPPDFDIEKVQLRFPVLYEQSMNQVLCQEMLRYNRLLVIIRSSLLGLDKALQGLQVMSGELDTVFRSLAIGAVPALWMAKSFPSLKPIGSYINDLLARLAMLANWYEVGQPSVFWISGFFFTPSFTTAALQNYARRNHLAIDTVAFDFVAMGTDPAAYSSPPEDGVYVHGLFLEGCAWDAGRKLLTESKPKVLFELAPVIWLRPCKAEETSASAGGFYECPVYRTADRRGVLATTGHSTNFLMMVRMPTDLPQHHWTLRGVCMLGSLSD